MRTAAYNELVSSCNNARAEVARLQADLAEARKAALDARKECDSVLSNYEDMQRRYLSSRKELDDALQRALRAEGARDVLLEVVTGVLK